MSKQFGRSARIITDRNAISWNTNLSGGRGDAHGAISRGAAAIRSKKNDPENRKFRGERVERRAFLDRVAVEGNSDSDRPCSQTLDVKQNTLVKKGRKEQRRENAADR